MSGSVWMFSDQIDDEDKHYNCYIKFTQTTPLQLSNKEKL